MRTTALALLALAVLAVGAGAGPIEDLEKELSALEAKLDRLTKQSLEARFDRPGASRFVVFDVADLTTVLTDFVRPQLKVEPAGAEFDEDAPMFGTAREGPTFFETEELAELLRSNVRPTVWEDDDATLAIQGRTLVVTAPPEVQKEVAAALTSLRRDLGRMVTVELRMVRASLANLPSEALSPREFDALLERFERGDGGELIAAAEVTGYAGQRLMVFDGLQRSFLQDYDVEVAQDAKIQDPIVSVIQEGLTFDVRGMPQGAGTGILLDIRAEYAGGHEMRRVELAVGPAELPRQHRTRAHATVTVPDGGGIVLGGTASAGRTGARIAFLVRARTTSILTGAAAAPVNREAQLKTRVATMKRLVAAYERAAEGGGALFQMRLYPVDDITFRPPDQPGPRLSLTPSGGGFFEEEEGAEPPETFEPEQLVDLIRSHVSPGSWEELLSTRIEFTGRNLVVVHTPGTHARIADFLRQLRERTSRLVALDVELVGISDADRRALRAADGSPILTPSSRKRLTGWIEEGRAKVLHAGRILARSNQRVALVDLEPVSYVYDYDVEIAQSASISDPLISMVDQGLVVDVRPTVAGRGRHVVMECRMYRAVLPDGPIPQVQTEIGAIETPELRFTSLGCTVSIPEGATAVIGGGLGAGSGCLLLVTPRIVGKR